MSDSGDTESKVGMSIRPPPRLEDLPSGRLVLYSMLDTLNDGTLALGADLLSALEGGKGKSEVMGGLLQ